MVEKFSIEKKGRRRRFVKREKIYYMQFAKVYPMLIAKAERKEGTRAEALKIITWLTGYDSERSWRIDAIWHKLWWIFLQAPMINPNRKKITGTICGVRVENIEEPLMQEIRFLDKMVDELAKGKKIEKILW